MNRTIKLSLALATTALLISGHAAFAATNDYTNYWSFDEGTGHSVNDSVGGQNGVLTGSSTAFGWASGKVGTAFGMDGVAGEAVVLPDGFLHGSQGTLSVWFKLNALSDQNIIFSGKSTSDTHVYAALYVDYQGRPEFQYRDSASGLDRKAQGMKVLNTNEWYNLVLIANAQGYHMYVNGVDIGVAGDNTGRWFPDITNQTFSYRIGALDSSVMSGVFTGILDELKIYNRPLSADEVGALYSEGNSGSPTMPVEIRPTLSFSISEDTVPFGGSVALNWSASKVDTCSASGNWNGDMPLSGTKVFTNLGSDAAYTLSCTGKGGIAAATVRVHVGTETATTTVATSTSTGLSVEVTSMNTSGGSMTQASASSMTYQERRAQISSLIQQILALIAQLQQQLATLKAQAVPGASY